MLGGVRRQRPHHNPRVVDEEIIPTAFHEKMAI